MVCGGKAGAGQQPESEEAALQAKEPKGWRESAPERPGARAVDLCLLASSPGLSLLPSRESGPAREGAGSGPGRTR